MLSSIKNEKSQDLLEFQHYYAIFKIFQKRTQITVSSNDKIVYTKFEKHITHAHTVPAGLRKKSNKTKSAKHLVYPKKVLVEKFYLFISLATTSEDDLTSIYSVMFVKKSLS